MEEPAIILGFTGLQLLVVHQYETKLLPYYLDEVLYHNKVTPRRHFDNFYSRTFRSTIKVRKASVRTGT